MRQNKNLEQGFDFIETHPALDHLPRNLAWTDIQATIDAVLDRRLDRRTAPPLIVAFSGGGDSLALLVAAKAWADAAGRRLHAITVDHRLQSAGAGWAAWCEGRATRLDVTHSTLVWTGDKPATGITAAARLARHCLIAEAARDLGAAVVLMGHTADDRLEGGWMREAGASVPDPRVWAPSPAWPEGRGVFILRPMLNIRRAAIRTGLVARGETWIDDPANSDPAQTRARARLALIGGGSCLPTINDSAPSALFDSVIEGRAGDLSITVGALAAAPVDEARLLVGAALLCAAGTSRPPRRARLDRLMDEIRGGEGFVATLTGARIESDGEVVRFMRDAGEFARRGTIDEDLPPGRLIVFDGRFELAARRAGLRLGPQRGRAAALSKAEHLAIKSTPPRARAGAPVVVFPDGAVTSPLFADHPDIDVRSLITPRLAAALSVINCESAVTRVAKSAKTS